MGGGKRSYCYIGPADSYVHVELLHALTLTNLVNTDPAQVAERALEELISSARFVHGKKDLEGWVARAKLAVDAVEIALEKLKRVLEEKEAELEALRREEERELLRQNGLLVYK